ncbi:hypothetical protein HRbin28_02203 [bacterium HR28]|nr:hypothetical protein HRbin28_02203 [bacterium HR28]
MSPLLLLFLGTCGLSSLIFCVVMLLLENRPYLDTVERLVLVQAFLFLLLSFVALVWYLL